MLVFNGDQITIMVPAPFLQIGIGKPGIPIPDLHIMFYPGHPQPHPAQAHRLRSPCHRRGRQRSLAKLTGVNPDRTRVIVYTISSVTVTIAGIVMASLTQQAYAMNATGYELDVITRSSSAAPA